MKRTRMSGGAVAVLIGSAIALLGAAVAVVYVFQPWRSCDYEDTAMGCVMLPMDATIMAVAVVASLVGLIVVAVGKLMARRL